MGLPIRKLIVASNSNNILTEFINTGTYNLSGRQLQMTSSPAIDILQSSNLERYLYAASNGNSSVVNALYQQLKENGRFRVSSLVSWAYHVCACISFVELNSILFNLVSTVAFTGFWKRAGTLIFSGKKSQMTKK